MATTRVAAQAKAPALPAVIPVQAGLVIGLYATADALDDCFIG